MVKLRKAPELTVQHWLNVEAGFDASQLSGRVVVIYAFQMLCPGCVEHSIPQARRLAELFSPEQVSVIGLHTVFEHHQAMGKASLEAFLHEYKVQFPVGIAQPGESSIPVTMQRYQMQGTPTLIMIDKDGMLRRKTFGMLQDIQLGAEVMSLVNESVPTTTAQSPSTDGPVCRA